MKAVLPVFCRPLGYFILVIALFIPFALKIYHVMNDHNWIFYIECTKLLMMAGALMILLALSKNESPKTEAIRITAIRRAVYLTIFFVFANMLYRVAIKDANVADSTSFLIFMIINVLCLEFGMAKERIDAVFKR